MDFKLDRTPAVMLKGTKEGLLITLGSGEWATVLADLEQQLERPGARAFFQGARVVVDTGARTLDDEQQAQLNGMLDAHGIQVAAGVAAPVRARPLPGATTGDTVYQREGLPSALMIRRTLRSGQIIRHPGHVVVYGDVNDGAEVIAGGDVLVWGRLRGLVHAGATGDNRATVGALTLTPPQIRIGGHIARAPEERKKRARGPEMASVREGRIIIEPWQV